VAGAVRAAQQEQQGRAWLAWHTAFLPMLKTFPKLADLSPSTRAPPRRQTAAEIEAAGLRWHFALNARKGPSK
jgi:hypothetical protein